MERQCFDASTTDVSRNADTVVGMQILQLECRCYSWDADATVGMQILLPVDCPAVAFEEVVTGLSESEVWTEVFDAEEVAG